jgi:hypothetical protein
MSVDIVHSTEYIVLSKFCMAKRCIACLLIDNTNNNSILQDAFREMFATENSQESDRRSKYERGLYVPPKEIIGKAAASREQVCSVVCTYVRTYQVILVL